MSYLNVCNLLKIMDINCLLCSLVGSAGEVKIMICTRRMESRTNAMKGGLVVLGQIMFTEIQVR